MPSGDRPDDEIAAVRALAEAQRTRALRQRTRLESDLESARAYGAGRDRALRQAREELARPLTSLAVRANWHLRRWRRVIDARILRRPAAPDARLPEGTSSKPIIAGGPRERVAAVAVATDTGLKVALHIGPETWADAARWGDTAYAEGLGAALRRLGCEVTIHVRADADSPAARTADGAVHIVGLDAPDIHPGQPTVLWLISHPDRISARIADRYDSVLVASETFAADLRARVHVPVEVLHQAADTSRFYPDPTGPAHELLFVGNSRNARRPILDALSATRHDLAVYGGGWRPDLIDPARVRGDWIPNEELRRYYSSAKIVLCDHWEDMRDEGFVANRVFDALACGAFVVSDHVLGIEDLFDGSVATFERPEDVPALVDELLGRDDERRARAERGRQVVLERHTLDHRARTIVDVIERIRASKAGGGRA
ncbi:MAG: hypothetical protein QOE42_587 [Chloroflexota bacterium]|nr:hypothetical protein [Chloroflexota bacterium]